jgi:hypothetical protein
VIRPIPGFHPRARLNPAIIAAPPPLSHLNAPVS